MSIYKHIALVAVTVMAAGFVGAEQTFERSVSNGTAKIESQIPAQKTLAIAGANEAKATLVDNGGRGRGNDRYRGHPRRRHNHGWGHWHGRRGLACYAHYRAQLTYCIATCGGNPYCVDSCGADHVIFGRRYCR